MAKVLVLMANGFEDIEAIAVIDILRRGGVEVVTASIHDRRVVKSAHGIRLEADALFADVGSATYDAIVLPGGGGGTENLRRSETVAERLRRQRDEGRLLCAICAAPTVLEAAGVLGENTEVTCYPPCRDGMRRPWAPAPVVVDRNVITGQAPGTATLFALVVLKTLVGERVARKVAQGMVTDVLG